MMVTAIDRAARNTRDVLNILDEVTRAGAKFKSLSERWCDSSPPTGELMITVLAGVVTFERHLIQVRTSEGRARAVANGVKLGPKRKLSPAQEQAARDSVSRQEPQRHRGGAQSQQHDREESGRQDRSAST